MRNGMKMSFEKLLADARLLVSRLKDHDSLADSLIASTNSLHNRIDAMKQYQDDITELNEIARHRPRSTLVLEIAQENRQIRELQQENRELRLCLEEHQSALELIMQKYREQVMQLIQGNKFEKTITRSAEQGTDYIQMIDKICEMAAVMQKAVSVDDAAVSKVQERLTQLEIENRGLREMLEICSTTRHRILEDDDMKSSKSSVQSEIDTTK
ncbi:Suppressor of IKBKE 1,FGFR1 oncogene partner 2 homolog,FGFR1 oncogene partner 2 [Acanthosepion pharaonis]|uniref:Suppressor of IKBKE 1,FGFR1 oncogene partner 2 homolog,FGFR1 oncogene partner 2 n=1 Tax=Acanthosepion pharaonis TaxID=158019 RepID=A0A812CHT9_ACAPH|nr:Suppressor of IKBKE 1,FGFR1 oncogene partner 2 homolog,FGFR1 oncogene partner 2 [Sepia pharaonis]